ncbi:carboxylesterase 1E [Megachile rotundata]|uniref:carboxylesterase 1E n=1 Tax=Megachile rotundata TaxID=143995 RepID=UPI000258D8BE|nr:PREDICTED: carboxylesterase 1E [Megachile rotundata]
MNTRSYILIIVLCAVLVESHNLKRQKRIVGGRAAAQPPIDDPVVYVTRNNRQARVFGSRDPNKGFYVFRGIRYGQPPVGSYRFQRPAPLYLEGDINATKWGPPCPQPNPNGKGIVGSEDCLFLNVFTPMLSDTSEGYPVLIWIHGGGFRRGSACQYEMRNIIRKRVVVVSIQYRLGTLGFLSNGTHELPGNNGIFDMILAVRWVKDYIQFFGGDPTKIVAFGHGTGASAAFMLALSNFMRGTFSGLIAMSGSILSHFAIDKDPQTTAQFIASQNGCPTNNAVEMVRCLREISVDKLIEADSSLEAIRVGVRDFVSGLSNILGPGPVIEGRDDGRFLPNMNIDTPENSLQFGDLPKIPLLTGVMNNEVGGAILGDYRNIIQDRLRSNPNFLNEYLIPTLQNAVPNFGNKTNFVPEAFSKYLNIFNVGDVSDSVSKIAEAMGDSLFNVPAFLTVEHWAKKSDAFLYSFDHNGKRNYGRDFLRGCPIANARHAADAITSHGDDLGYIFQRNTITGGTVPNFDESDEEDKRVEEVFTDMIAEFARNGKPNIPLPAEDDLLSNLTPTFSSDTNPFISITSTPRLMQQFRFCEIGLWTGLAQRLQSSTCNYFKTTLDVINYGKQTAQNTIKNPVQTLKEKVPEVIPNYTIPINNPIPTGINISPKNTKSGHIFRSMRHGPHRSLMW